jgi:hypothetical protein
MLARWQPISASRIRPQGVKLRASSRFLLRETCLLSTHDRVIFSMSIPHRSHRFRFHLVFVTLPAYFLCLLDLPFPWPLHPPSVRILVICYKRMAFYFAFYSWFFPTCSNPYNRCNLPDLHTQNLLHIILNLQATASIISRGFTPSYVRLGFT